MILQFNMTYNIFLSFYNLFVFFFHFKYSDTNWYIFLFSDGSPVNDKKLHKVSGFFPVYS